MVYILSKKFYKINDEILLKKKNKEYIYIFILYRV